MVWADGLWYVAIGAGLAFATLGLAHLEHRGWFVIERKYPEF